MGPENGSDGKDTSKGAEHVSPTTEVPPSQGTAPEETRTESPAAADRHPWSPRPHRGFRQVLGSVGTVYLRRLGPLLVVLSVPAVPALLMAEMVLLWSPMDTIVVNARTETLGSLKASQWVFLGAAALVGLVATPIGLGGVLLLGGGALLGRRITVTAAWRQALRRYPTILALLLTLMLWAALFLGLLWVTLFVWELAPPLVWVWLLPPALYTLPVLIVALPVALLEGHGLFLAIATAWLMGRFRRSTHLMFVALAFGLGYAVRELLEHLTTWAALQTVVPLVVMTVTALISTLMAPLWPLLICAPVAQSDPDTHIRDLDLAALDRQLPRTDPASSRRFPALVLLSALALLFSAIPDPLMLWVTNATQLRIEPVDLVSTDEATFALEARDDRTLLSSFQRGTTVLVCDPECTPTGDRWGAYNGGATLLTDTGFVDTAWKEFQHEDAEGDDKYAPHEDSGLYLRHCADLEADCSESKNKDTLIRPYRGDHYDLYTAIAPLSEGLVVVSHARFDTFKAQDHDLEDRGGLQAHVCKDLACADPHTVILPEDLTAGAFLSDGTLLDVATTPEDGFTISVYNGRHGGINLVHCPDTECTEPEVTQVVADVFVAEYEGYLIPRFGARIEYRPDGTPVVAHRAAQDGAVHVVDCHDTACTEFTDRALTGAGWARPVPGLALDSLGNPQLATFDMATEQVVLISCLDSGCTKTTTVPLQEFEEEPALTALTLDQDDRPHLVWAQGTPYLSFTRDFSAEAEYVHCLQPRCGADGMFFAADPVVEEAWGQTP